LKRHLADLRAQSGLTTFASSASGGRPCRCPRSRAAIPSSDAAGSQLVALAKLVLDRGKALE
jgi:hypothetical protein